MPAISGPDLTLWRTNPYLCELALYFDAPPIIFQAQVDAPSGVTYPVADIGFKNVTIGSHSVLKPGMLVVFESALGTDDQGRSLIRRIDGSTSQVRIGNSSQGENDGTINVADNSYIKVYDDRRILPEIPYIDPTTLVSYKFFDFAFDPYGVNEGAIVNLSIGPVWFKELKPAETTATLSINSATNSYGFDGNIVSYANDIVDGSYTSGGATTASWTATFPPGRRYIRVTTTDTNSVTSYRELLVIVAKDGTAWETVKHWELTSELNFKWIGGTSIGVKILDDIPRSSYPDGFLAVLTETETYGDTTAILNDQSLGSGVIFCGWHEKNDDKVSGTAKGTLKDATLTFLDVAARLDTLPGFSQEMCRKALPTIWSQKKGANFDAYEIVLSRWHSTTMRVTDFHGANKGDQYAFSILGSGEQTLYKQQEELADRGLGYHLTCTAQGRLLLNPDPQLLPTNQRTSTVIIELFDGDITDIRYSEKRPPVTYWEKGGAVLTSTTDFDNNYIPTVKFAIGPGTGPGWGSSTKENNQQLCISLGEILTRTANRYARENATFGYVEVDLKWLGNFGYDPAYLQWIKLNLSAENAAQRGITFNGQRCLLVGTKVSYRASKEGVIKDKVTLVLEVETVGSGVVEEVQSVDPNPPAVQPVTTTPTGVSSSPVGNITHNGLSILVLEGLTSGTPKGKLGGTVNLGSHWFDSTGSGLTGELCDMKFDPFSPMLTIQSGSLGLWVATSDGLFYSSNVLVTSPSFTLTQALSSNGGTGVIIRPSPSDIGVVYVGYVISGSLPVYARLSNYGSTIDHSHAIGTLYLGTLGPHSPAMDIDSFGADEMYVTATDISTDTTSISWYLFRITGGGTPVRLDDTEIPHNADPFVIRFVQKPLNKFGGGVNNGLDSNAHLFWFVGDANLGSSAHHIYYSTTGATTSPTDIRFNDSSVITCKASSVIATDNSDVMFFIDDNTGHLWTTRNRGGTWTDCGVATGGDFNPFGYFPRQIGGNYVLYYAANNKIYYSPDFGVTKIEITGDWSTSIGTPGQYFTVIPIY